MGHTREPTGYERREKMASSNADSIRARLTQFCTLPGFEYRGIPCDVDPFDAGDFHMRCGDAEMDVDSIDQVMTLPFFQGRSLRDIADEIEITSW